MLPALTEKYCNWKGLPVYSLDLATLLMMLEGLQHTGQLQATVPTGTPHVSAGKAVITVMRGRITDCVIFDQHGQLALSGQHALQLVKHLGALGWRPAQNAANHTKTTLQVETSSEQRSYPPQQVSPEQRAYPPQQVSPDQWSYIPLPQQTSPLQRLDFPQTMNTTQRSAMDWPAQPTQLSPHVTRNPLPHITGLIPSVTAPSPHATRRQPPPQIPESLTLSQPGSPLLAALTPQRKTSIDGQTLTKLPRPLRRVLVLVDGNRSIGKITDLLYANQGRISEVLDALRELERTGIITLAGS